MQYPTALNRQLLSAAMGLCTITAEPSASATQVGVGFTLLFGPEERDSAGSSSGTAGDSRTDVKVGWGGDVLLNALLKISVVNAGCTAAM